MQGRAPADDPDRLEGYHCNLELLGRYGDQGGYKVHRYTDEAGNECGYYDSTLLFPGSVRNEADLLGAYVLDMADPANPVKTANLVTPAMLSPHEVLELNQERGLLAAGMGYPTFNPGFVDLYDGMLLAAVAAFAGGAVWGNALEGAPDASSVDVGFLRDMIDHHEQAVQMALIQLANGESELLAGFALDIVASQRYEIGLMEARLQDWGHGRGEVTREAMVWMGHGMAVTDMPGMAGPEDLAAFADAEGRDVDARFIDLMTAHHEGGIHMAEHAGRHAEHRPVRELADRMAKLQRMEIRDLRIAGMGLRASD